MASVPQRKVWAARLGRVKCNGLPRTRLSGLWLLSAFVGNVCAGAGGKRRVGGRVVGGVAGARQVWYGVGDG